MFNKIITTILLISVLIGIQSALFISPVQAASEPVTTTTFQSTFPNCEPDLTNARPLDEASLSAHAIMWYNETSGWQCDAEVTFTGKLAARSREVLNWLLQNYGWSNIQSGQDNPFQGLWIFIRNIVFAVLLLFVLVAGFLLMITRGRSITVRRFLIRFIFIALLVWFSFSLVKTIYDFTDIIQSFFINVTDSSDPSKTRVIQTVDLLNISFDYEDFWGYRKPGLRFDESAITSLILIKVTAATYYTMFIILIVRKIILWFFILVSPIFPLLLFVKPIRNTAKIWIGEFFRWVLYAPLFMIFLRGLVEIWRFGPRGETGIPLFMDLTKAYANPDPKILEYPTAINILLGGPGKFPLAGNQNINFTETFLLYLVALIMLWMVIIMPWLLLKIFLDMCCNQGVGQSVLSLFNRPNTPWGPFINRPPVGPNGPINPPPGAAGLAKSLPMTRFKHTPVAEMQQNLMLAQQEAENQQSTIQSQTSSIATGINQMATQASTDAYQSFGQLISSQPLKIPNLETGQVTAELLSATDLSIPTMQDIAKYEAAMMSKNKSSSTNAEVSRMNEMLSRLAGTSKLTSPAESNHFTKVRERIVQESHKGNAVAKSMASAVAPAGSVPIPENNDVQQVNLDDYEEVKKTWEENYRNLEAPEGPGGQPQTRSQWLKAEVAQIPTIIDMLLSGDPQLQQQGMQKVSQVLPFLLLGGFSKAEIVSYLKAKLEAAKTVLTETLATEKKQDEADTLVSRSSTQHAAASMHMSAQVDPNAATTSSSAPSSEGGGDEEESPLTNPIIASLAGQPAASRLIAEGGNQSIATLLSSAHLSVPTLKEIAKYEAAIISNNQEDSIKKQAEQIQQQIKNLATDESPVKQQIVQEAAKGTPLAVSLSSAAHPVPGLVVIPEMNKVQQVNLDDYQDVQNTWVENYRQLEVPKSATGQAQSRGQWLKEEVAQIPTIIDMLLSGDPQVVQQGMQKVSQVLPFLLLGGFSKAEIISYLKAKLEAAKRVLNEVLQVEQKQTDEDSQLPSSTPVVSENKLAAELPAPSGDSKDNLS